MLVRCEVPASPRTYEDELKLVSELALKGHDFETRLWRGEWITPKRFFVWGRYANGGILQRSSLMWLSEYQTWYKKQWFPSNNVISGDIPTDHWDPQPVLLNYADFSGVYHVGPDGLAAQKLGIMTDKLAQLKAKWE